MSIFQGSILFYFIYLAVQVLNYKVIARDIFNLGPFLVSSKHFTGIKQVP